MSKEVNTAVKQVLETALDVLDQQEIRDAGIAELEETLRSMTEENEKLKSAQEDQQNRMLQLEHESAEQGRRIAQLESVVSYLEESMDVECACQQNMRCEDEIVEQMEKVAVQDDYEVLKQNVQELTEENAKLKQENASLKQQLLNVTLELDLQKRMVESMKAEGVNPCKDIVKDKNLLIKAQRAEIESLRRYIYSKSINSQHDVATEGLSEQEQFI